MDKRNRFVDKNTGEEFTAVSFTDENNFNHLCADCVSLDGTDVDWSQLRREMIREIMFARFKDGALDLPWKTISAKVGAMVDAFIAEMKKGAVL